MIFIDTGALLARYLANDQYHAVAVKQSDQIEQSADRCITNNFVIGETLTLLGRRASYVFAADRARAFYASRNLEVVRPTEADEFSALVYLEKYADQKVSFVDCLSFALMKQLKINAVFSFDRHFQLAGFTVVPDQS